MDAFVYFIADPVWYMLPAFVGNASALWATKLPIPAWPVDGGAVFRGRRVFGDHKTWRGIVVGVFVGMIVATLQGRPLLHGAVLAFGNFLGDLLGAFVKRQRGLKSGESSLLVDAIPSPVVALASGALVIPVPLTLSQSVLVVAATVPLHMAANRFWHAIRLKSVPW